VIFWKTSVVVSMESVMWGGTWSCSKNCLRICQVTLHLCIQVYYVGSSYDGLSFSFSFFFLHL
jgi:hypothetical protein